MSSLNIKENKDQFESILRTLTRDSDVEGLIKYLESTDFFLAPATPTAYGAYEGGLCEHALMRYQELVRITQGCELEPPKNITQDSLIIVGLLADIGKVNYYELSTRNRKQFSEYTGKEEWVSERVYTTKPPDKRYIYGTFGETTTYILSNYVAMTRDESASILHLRDDFENPNSNLATYYMEFPLAVFLNCADKLAAFITTRVDYNIPF